MKVIKQEQTAQIIDMLADGQVGVLPTDTVYGLVCVARNKASVERLYGLKSREKKPGTLIAADLGQLVNLGIKFRYLKAVEQFWPGPVSVIIPCSGLEYLRLDASGLAVRIPDDDTIIKMLQSTGPLITTSANKPGEPVAYNLRDAQNFFGDRIDFYVDGGDLSPRKPSTIIRMVDDAIEVIREGETNITN